MGSGLSLTGPPGRRRRPRRRAPGRRARRPPRPLGTRGPRPRGRWPRWRSSARTGGSGARRPHRRRRRRTSAWSRVALVVGVAGLDLAVDDAGEGVVGDVHVIGGGGAVALGPQLLCPVEGVLDVDERAEGLRA